MAVDRKKLNQMKSHMKTVSEEQKNSYYGKGNIDLNNRPVVKNDDGSISTVRSMSFYDDDEKKEILVPTVVNGQIVDDDEAIRHYYETGEHLGKFDSTHSANKYAQMLHEQQEKQYSDPKTSLPMRDAPLTNHDPKEFKTFNQKDLSLEDKWYQKFLQNSKAFEDNDSNTGFGEKVVDVGKTGLATVADLGGHFFKVFSDAGDALAENTMRGVAKIEDIIGGDEATNRWGLNDRANRWRRAINQYHKEGSLYEQSLDKVQDYSIAGDTTDRVAEGIGYTWATVMGSGILEEAGIASEITAGIGNLKVNMPVVSMLHSFNTGMAEGFTDEDKKAWEVVLNSLGEAGIDGFTEGMFGMFNVGGSTLDDQLKGLISSKCSSGFLKAVSQLGMSAVGEGTEELASYIMEYAWHNGVMQNLDKAFNGVDESNWKEAFSSEQMWENFWTSAISSAFSNGLDTVTNCATTSNALIEAEKQRRGRELTEEEIKDIKEGVLYDQMYANEQEALGRWSEEAKAQQQAREEAYFFEQINKQDKSHVLELDENGNEIVQEEEITPAEERMELRKEIQNFDGLTDAQKRHIMNDINENTNLDNVKTTVQKTALLNSIEKGDTTVEDAIKESDITDNQKMSLLMQYEQGKDARRIIDKLFEGNYGKVVQTEEVTENQLPTIENEPLLETEQQTTQEEPQAVQMPTSEETEQDVQKILDKNHFPSVESLNKTIDAIKTRVNSMQNTLNNSTDERLDKKYFESELERNKGLLERYEGIKQQIDSLNNVDINQNIDYNNLSNKEIYNEFRRIQKESKRISSEEQQLYRNGSKRITEALRGRLQGVFTRRLESNSSRNGYNARVLKDAKTGTEFNVYENVDAKTFHDIFEIARTYTQNGELVDVHDTADYENNYNVISQDGLSGYSITPEGDLISVFNASNKRGWLRSIAEDVKSKAKTLDCYASPNQDLQGMYAKIFGFKTASIMDYDMQYDHDDIAKNHNNPQVAFMVNTNQEVETKKFTDYDKAVEYRNSFINNENSQDESSFSLPDNKGRTLTLAQQEFFKDSTNRNEKR